MLLFQPPCKNIPSQARGVFILNYLRSKHLTSVSSHSLIFKSSNLKTSSSKSVTLYKTFSVNFRHLGSSLWAILISKFYKLILLCHLEAPISFCYSTIDTGYPTEAFGCLLQSSPSRVSREQIHQLFFVCCHQD